MSDLKRKFIETTVSQRTIFLSGKITADMERDLSHALIYLNAISSDPIALHISSPGGDVLPGLDIYDRVRMSNAPVRGIVVGQAASMAAVVLQGCTKRSIARHGNVMVHTIRVHVELDDLSPENIEKTLKSFKEEQERIYSIFQGRTERSISEIRKVFSERQRFSSEEALSFGLVDEIV